MTKYEAFIDELRMRIGHVAAHFKTDSDALFDTIHLTPYSTKSGSGGFDAIRYKIEPSKTTGLEQEVQRAIQEVGSETGYVITATIKPTN